jgi:hypothetical protein
MNNYHTEVEALLEDEDDAWDNNDGRDIIAEEILNIISDDNPEMLQQIMLEEEIHPNTAIDEFPLLSYALGENTHPKSGALLLSLGASPNIYFDHYYEKITPLMYAVEELNPTAVRMMMKAGANPKLKSRDKYQQTAYDMVESHLKNRRISNSALQAAQEIARLLKTPASRENIRKTKRALKSHVRNVMGSLAVRGRLPANIVHAEVLPFLSTRYTRKRRDSSKSPKRSRSRSSSRS